MASVLGVPLSPAPSHPPRFSKWETRTSLVCAPLEGRGVWLAELGPSPTVNAVPSVPSPWELLLGTGKPRGGASSGEWARGQGATWSLPCEGPTPASGGGMAGGGGWLSEGRRAICNISYLQLAHLPQVFGAAFLPSYLPD